MVGSVAVTLHLEGSFTGWRVDAAQRCLDNISSANQGLAVSIDSSAMTKVDDSGRRFLQSMRRQGVEVISTVPVTEFGEPVNQTRSATASNQPRALVFAAQSEAYQSGSVARQSAVVWTVVRALLLVGILEPVSLWIWTLPDAVVYGELMLGVIALSAIVALIWKNRAENTRRFSSAVNRYAIQEIARQTQTSPFTV